MATVSSVDLENARLIHKAFESQLEAAGNPCRVVSQNPEVSCMLATLPLQLSIRPSYDLGRLGVLGWLHCSCRLKPHRISIAFSATAILRPYGGARNSKPLNRPAL